MTLEPEGAAPALVHDHPFHAEPWWERCDHCGLAMPSHAEVDIDTFEAMLTELSSLPHPRGEN